MATDNFHVASLFRLPVLHPAVSSTSSNEKCEHGIFRQGEPTDPAMPRHPWTWQHANKNIKTFLAAIRQCAPNLKAKGLGHKGTGFTLDSGFYYSKYRSNNKTYTATRPMPNSEVPLPNKQGSKKDAFVESQLDSIPDLNNVAIDQREASKLVDERAGTERGGLGNFLIEAGASNEPYGYELLFATGGCFTTDMQSNPLIPYLRQIRDQPGVSNADMTMLAFALSEASGKDAAIARDALTYLCSIDLIKEIKNASERPVSGLLPEPGLDKAVSGDVKNMAWRTAQLLSTSAIGLKALKAIAKKDDSYEFHELALTVFLRTAKRMSEARMRTSTGDMPITPHSLIVFGRHWGEGTLLHRGLCAAAKRLTYEFKKDQASSAGATKPDDQPDLNLLSWKEKRDFSLVRNGQTSDAPGSPVHMADYRTTKAVDSWVRRAMNRFNFVHKSPMSQITNKGLQFMMHGGIGEYQGMADAVKEMRDAISTWNKERPKSPPAGASVDEEIRHRTAIVRDYVREAILEIWNGKMLWESKDGMPFSERDEEEVRRLLHGFLQIQPGLQPAGNDSNQWKCSIELSDLMVEFSRQKQVQATPELLQEWWSEIQAEAGPNMHSACKNEPVFNSAIQRAKGERVQNASWPDNVKGMSEKEGRQRIVEAIKETWSGLALSSTLKAKDGHAIGATSKNFLQSAFSAFSGAGFVQIKPSTAFNISDQAVFSWGVSGDSASISFLKRKAKTDIVGGGLSLGPKFKIAHQGASAGVGFDGAYSDETAHSEGVIYRIDRKGFPARGNYRGRPAGLPGDTQLMEEMSAVSEVLLRGVTEDEKAEGMTPMQKVLSTFPDSLSLTIVTPEDDQEHTGIGTFSLNGGATATLGPYRVGPAATVLAGRRTTMEARTERGDAISIDRRTEGSMTQVSAGLGLGGSAVQKISDTAVQGIGSINAALTWDLFLSGKNVRTSLMVVNGEVAKNSHRVVTHASLDGLVTSILSRLDTLAAQLAKRAIDSVRREKEGNGERLSDDDQRRITDAARQHIVRKLTRFQEDLAMSHSFVEFSELTQEAADRLNLLFAIAQIPDATNQELHQWKKSAIDAVTEDPRSWVLTYGLAADAKDVTSALGINVGPTYKRQTGQFTSHMRNFIIFK